MPVILLVEGTKKFSWTFLGSLTGSEKYSLTEGNYTFIYYKIYVTWETAQGSENLKRQLDLTLFLLGLMNVGSHGKNMIVKENEESLVKVVCVWRGREGGDRGDIFNNVQDSSWH